MGPAFKDSRPCSPCSTPAPRVWESSISTTDLARATWRTRSIASTCPCRTDPDLVLGDDVPAGVGASLRDRRWPLVVAGKRGRLWPTRFRAARRGARSLRLLVDLLARPGADSPGLPVRTG